MVNWNWGKNMEFLGSLTNRTENAEQKISEKNQEAKLMVTRIPGIKGNEKMQTRSVFNKTSLTAISQMLWLFFFIPFSKSFCSHQYTDFLLISQQWPLCKKIKQTLSLSYLHLKSIQKS